MSLPFPERIVGFVKSHEKAETQQPIQVTHVATLYEARFWSEAEWASLPIKERPSECTHKPGVGWVGIVPIAGLN